MTRKRCWLAQDAEDPASPVVCCVARSRKMALLETMEFRQVMQEHTASWLHSLVFQDVPPGTMWQSWPNGHTFELFGRFFPDVLLAQAAIEHLQVTIKASWTPWRMNWAYNWDELGMIGMGRDIPKCLHHQNSKPLVSYVKIPLNFQQQPKQNGLWVYLLETEVGCSMYVQFILNQFHATEIHALWGQMVFFVVSAQSPRMSYVKKMSCSAIKFGLLEGQLNTQGPVG